MGKRGPQPKSEKLCRLCGFIRPREDFVYGGIVRHLCRDHYAERHRQDYLKHADTRRAWHVGRNEADRPSHRHRQRANLLNKKRIVFEHYGGSPPQCQCCGESTFEFLALDHIDGGGTKHRQGIVKRPGCKSGGGLHTYRWAIENGFPPIFRVLCHNCNSAYGFYGYCPHKVDTSGIGGADPA